MKKEKCGICQKVAGVPDFGPFICKDCRPVQNICCTSADEGIKYGIPKASLDVLYRALKYEQKRNPRATMLAALRRAIQKLEKSTK